VSALTGKNWKTFILKRQAKRSLSMFTVS